jgi:hypothetical protein
VKKQIILSKPVGVAVYFVRIVSTQIRSNDVNVDLMKFAILSVSIAKFYAKFVAPLYIEAARNIVHNAKNIGAYHVILNLIQNVQKLKKYKKNNKSLQFTEKTK